MKDLYNPENDENFGTEMLQNALAEAKKQSTLDEALAVLNSAMAAFTKNTEALNRIDRTQKAFTADSAPFMETAQKLIPLLEGIMEGKIPTNAVKIVNNNTLALANALGKVVNEKIDETDKAFYKVLDEREKALKKQLSDIKSVLVPWNVIYLLSMLFLGLTAFAAIIFAKNFFDWDNRHIYVISFWTVGFPLLILMIVGGVKIYRYLCS